MYNRFLDIMKDVRVPRACAVGCSPDQFKSQSIDTPGVIERVSTLFRGHPSLIQGFNTFLPPGYRIECGIDQNDSNVITVTTPAGTTTQSLGGEGIAGSINRINVGKPAGEAPGAEAPPAGPQDARGAPYRASPMPGPQAPPVREQPAPRDVGYPYQGELSGPPPGGPPGYGAPPPHGMPGPPGGAEYAEHGPPPGPPAGGGMPVQGHPPSPRAMGVVPPGGAPGAPVSNGAYGMHGRGAPPDTMPRPPVEFNHAINYVNKIKQRFSGDPDTYKQFLEILQTYQKEQRPIQEVYAQVTVLFDHEKDLLDEFKQFLPDTTAPGAMPSSDGLFGMLGHVTMGMGGGGVGGGSGSWQRGAAPEVPGPMYDGGAPGARRPQVGAGGGVPPGASGRKKRSASGTEGGVPMDASGSMSKGAPGRSKRSKHGKGDGMVPPGGGLPYGMQPLPPHAEMMGGTIPPYAEGMPPYAETLPPADAGYMPPVYGMQAYPPPHVMGGGMVPMPHMASVDEVAFFDRVKKHLDDRTTYIEFLKLLNLYTQDVIDIGTLVDRAALFLGPQSDLLATFKALCGYDMGKHGWLEHEDPIMENVPALERERIDLSTQKQYGPSYRKLPPSEINLSCSGRDPLCWEVLNDSWVSYPTWGAEGESFNPHKKNVYEDALYRSEEERHEYDYHIEANLRTIALLEPIAARIAAMEPEERAAFRLKPGLGGQSKSIYQRVIKKVYGRDHGLEVIAALHDNPSVAVPVVLARLKQKDEEWKRAQREWNKVWREVDARNFYKALDHQGINFKSTDKKTITTKAFLNEIETLRTAQQQRRISTDPSLPKLAPRFQLSYAIEDTSVLFDVLRLALRILDRPSSGFSAGERERIEQVLNSFVPLLLDQDAEAFAALLARRHLRREDRAEDEEDAASGSYAESRDDDSASESGASRSDVARAERARRAGDLRKHVLKNHTEHAADEEPEPEPAGVPASTWHLDATQQGAAGARETAAKPHAVSLFANTTLYVFVRLLQLLYARLHALKEQGARMSREKSASWSKVNPLAAQLGLMDTASGPAGIVNGIALMVTGEQPAAGKPLVQVSPARYYDIFMELVDRLFDGEMDQATFEECVRYMYGIHGYVAFTVDKVVNALAKGALTISSDAKCRELIQILEATEAELHTLDAEAQRGADGAHAHDVRVYKRLISSRMQAEQLVGRDEHLFRIEVQRTEPGDAGAWSAATAAEAEHAAADGVPVERIREVLRPRRISIQLLSHDDPSLEDPQDAEQRWLQYISSYCLWEPTEGLTSETRAPLLKRNLPAHPSAEAMPEGMRYVLSNGLDIRVCMRTYRLFFVRGTEDVFARIYPPGAIDKHVAERNRTNRARRWHDWLEARRQVIESPDVPEQAGAAMHEERQQAAEPHPEPAGEQAEEPKAAAAAGPPAEPAPESGDAAPAPQGTGAGGPPETAPKEEAA